MKFYQLKIGDTFRRVDERVFGPTVYLRVHDPAGKNCINLGDNEEYKFQVFTMDTETEVKLACCLGDGECPICGLPHEC
jgi:hypothetical protein